MAVYIKLGKAWGVGLPWWLAVWVLPFWMLYAGVILSWDFVLFSWWALVWTYKTFAWLYRDSVKSIEYIKEHRRK